MPIKTKQLESQKIPKLRFAEFEGEWERKRLGEVVEFLRGKGISKEDVIENGKNKCIRYGELYTEYQEVIFEVKSRTNVTQEHSIVSRIDDVLMPSSGETALDISTASCVKENNILLGGDLNIMRPEGTQNGTFIAYYLTNYQSRDIARLAQGHSVVHLYASHLKNLKLRLPLFTEQQKIANFLISLDNLIESKQQEIAQAEEWKKGLMQEMFV